MVCVGYDLFALIVLQRANVKAAFAPTEFSK
jgi:hypothetical protein